MIRRGVLAASDLFIGGDATAYTEVGRLAIGDNCMQQCASDTRHNKSASQSQIAATAVREPLP